MIIGYRELMWTLIEQRGKLEDNLKTYQLQNENENAEQNNTWTSSLWAGGASIIEESDENKEDKEKIAKTIERIDDYKIREAKYRLRADEIFFEVDFTNNKHQTRREIRTKFMIVRYLLNYAQNRFRDLSLAFMPRWRLLENQGDITNTIRILSSWLVNEHLNLGFSHYASIANLNASISRSATFYRNAITMYYFAIWLERRCRFKDGRNEKVMENLSPFYRDFWNDKIEVYYEYDSDDRSHENKIRDLRLAYLELSKLIYLPFIYGYDFNCITQCTFERDRIIWDLMKVRYRYFKAPNDISKVLKAMMQLSGHISDPLISDSKYLQLQADEYVKLYDATTDEEIEERNNVLNSLQSFKQKKNKVNRDPELNAYLRVFMNTVTSSYRIAELIGIIWKLI